MFNTVFIRARQFFPTVSQSSPANALTSYFYEINFSYSYILFVTSRSSKWFFPPDFPAKTLYAALICLTCHAHFIPD